MLPFPIVDSHLHIWDASVCRIPWLPTVPVLNRSFSLCDYNDGCGSVAVDAMVFLECDVDPASVIPETAWVTEQAKGDPRIGAIVAHAPLERGNAVLPHFDQLASFPLVRGVRRLLQQEADPEFCLRPGFIEGVKLLGRRGWSFDICVTYRQMESVIRLADLCPDIPMVLDHLGKPCVREGLLEPWRTQLRELARRENVDCKLSGLATEADHRTWTREEIKPFILAALEAFGPQRTMFGGDWPVSTQAISYPKWVDVVDWATADFTVAERLAIFRDTAKRFYRLPSGPRTGNELESAARPCASRTISLKEELS